MNALPTSAKRRSAVARPRQRDNFVPLLAVACVACYVLRHSLLPHVFSNPYLDLLAPLTIVVLTVAAAYVATSGIGRFNRWGLLLIVATGISLIHCERFDFAFPRWLGWAMLLFALGPINSTARAGELRRQMLAAVNVTFIVITFLSSVWWAAGMPNLGRGDFTGVMGHSMVLGPIAGYVGVLSLSHLFSRGSLLWVVPYANSWLVAMLASSRAALAAAMIGTLVIIAVNFKRNLVLSFALLAVAAVVAIMPTESLDFSTQFLPNSLTEGLANKRWNNSREQHWNARWEEFLASPATGIGFASAWEDTVGVDDETGSVETGSSYFAVLSMTGCVGAAAWLAFAVSVGTNVLRSWWRLSDRERLAICGMASFWTVHLGAEGYIYAVGSLVGVLFWLWLGCLNDRLCESARRPARLKLVTASTARRLNRRTTMTTARARSIVQVLNR